MTKEASPEQKNEIKMLENGLCFILKSIEYLEYEEKLRKDGKNTKEDDRNIKYAICHLHSGIFLILKEKLRQEHWSLLFQHPDKASKKEFYLGSFQGVNFEQCKKRLGNISLISFDQKTETILNTLREKRNKAEHFFFKENIASIKSILASSLRFIIDFLENNMNGDKLSDQVNVDIEQIKRQSFQLEEFVGLRFGEIKQNLDERCKDEKGFPFPLTCLWCNHKALVFSESQAFLECLFCLSEAHPDEYDDLQECIDVSGFYKDYEMVECSECGHHDGIVKSKESQLFLCLHCQSEFNTQCNSCSRFISVFQESSLDMCSDCYENKYSNY